MNPSDPRELPHTRFSEMSDRVIQAVGRAISWIWVLLTLVVVANVILRYALGRGLIQLEELQWHLYAVGLLFGLAWCLQSDTHVRIDVVSRRLSPTMRAWIELYGLVLLLLPFIALVLVYAVPFVRYAFATGEISQAPGGLPLRWLIKSALPLAFALLLLAALSRLSRVLCYLFGVPQPRRVP